MTVSDRYPPAPAGPLSPEQRQVFDTLAALGIPYERVEHDWANTMEDCKAVSAALGVDVCKNLVLCNRQKTQFYLLCMPSSKPFHTKDLSHQLGFDREHRVQLVMDRETKACEYFSCHPCESTGTLKLRTRDVLEVFLPHTGHQPVAVELPWE